MAVFLLGVITSQDTLIGYSAVGLLLAVIFGNAPREPAAVAFPANGEELAIAVEAVRLVRAIEGHRVYGSSWMEGFRAHTNLRAEAHHIVSRAVLVSEVRSLADGDEEYVSRRLAVPLEALRLRVTALGDYLATLDELLPLVREWDTQTRRESVLDPLLSDLDVGAVSDVSASHRLMEVRAQISGLQQVMEDTRKALLP